MLRPIVRQSLCARGIHSLTPSLVKSPRPLTLRTARSTNILVGFRRYSDQPTRAPSDASKANPGQSDSSSSSFGSEDTGDHAEKAASQPRSRLSTWLTALLLAGVGLTAYGLGEIWGSMTIWPKEVRSDLRQGLLEDMRGDRDISAQYLARAWETAKKMTVEHFGLHPYLKTSGIAIALAGVLEADGKGEQAYRVYQEALNQVQEGPEPSSRLRSGLSGPERMRCVAIAHKLGELAEKLHKPEEEEKWLVYSVEMVLKDVMGASPVTEFAIERDVPDEKEDATGMMGQLKLPLWAMKHDLAAPFEALGSFYSKAGKVSYAMPLFLQAISILIPPPPQFTTADDQCRAAQLMGNISELILRTNKEPEAVVQAESWANKGLEVATRVRKSTFTKHPMCEQAYAMMLYNLAMIRDMSGDQDKAQQLLALSLAQSKSIGLEEGVHNAERAIKELGQHMDLPPVVAKGN